MRGFQSQRNIYFFGGLFARQIQYQEIKIVFFYRKPILTTMDDKENLPENVALSQSSQQGSQPQFGSQKQNAPRLLITKLVLENFKSYAGNCHSKIILKL